MNSPAVQNDAAPSCEEIRLVREADCLAWLREWGFMAAPLDEMGSPRSGHCRDHGLDDEMMLRIVAGSYRRPDPEARLLNALRIHKGRQALIDQGSYTIGEIAEHKLQHVNSVHKQVSRACRRGELFTVKFNGEKHVPAALLDDALEVRPHWRPVISALADAHMSGWGIWHWIAEPNAGLSGETAVLVIESNPDRVYAAAQRRVEQITS